MQFITDELWRLFQHNSVNNVLIFLRQIGLSYCCYDSLKCALDFLDSRSSLAAKCLLKIPLLWTIPYKVHSLGNKNICGICIWKEKKKKNLSSFFFLDAKRKYRKESWKEVEISSFLFIDKLYIMMILDDRYTLTLFCILYFESVTMLQKGKSKRTIKNKMHEISHLNLLKRIYPWTL